MTNIGFSIPKNDLLLITKVFFRKIGILFLFVIGLYFDGTNFAQKVPDTQFYLNIFSVITFLLLYYRSTKRTQKLMIIAVIIGFIGEHFFSKYLGMYTYRLGNVPWYVPFGHAAVYARVYLFSKSSIVVKHKHNIVNLLTIIIAIYATLFLILMNDVFGFVMTLIIFAILWKRPQDRIFFLTMYTVVAVLEIAGTSYQCWYWPKTAFNIIPFLKSYNPPSGISLFYYTLDIGCFVFYRIFNKTTWVRYKKISQLKTPS